MFTKLYLHLPNLNKLRKMLFYYRILLMNLVVVWMTRPVGVLAAPPTPDPGDGGGVSGGYNFGEGFGGFNIFEPDYFDGTPYEITLNITHAALNIFFTLGMVFFAWRIASTAWDFFNQDMNHINYRSNERTLFYEILEPLIGLLILTVLDMILNLIFSRFLSAAGDLNHTNSNTFNIEELDPGISPRHE